MCVTLSSNSPETHGKTDYEPESIPPSRAKFVLEESLTREKRKNDSCRLWASNRSRYFHTRTLCPVHDGTEWSQQPQEAITYFQVPFKMGKPRSEGCGDLSHVTQLRSHSVWFRLHSLLLLSTPLLLDAKKGSPKGAV